jgi:hypothetical protein
MKKASIQTQLKEHLEARKIELERLYAELAGAHDLRLHLAPGLKGRILEVEKEVEYLESLLYD